MTHVPRGCNRCSRVPCICNPTPPSEVEARHIAKEVAEGDSDVDEREEAPDDDFDYDPGFEDYIEMDPMMMGETPGISIVGPGMRGMSDQDRARYARRRNLRGLALQFLLVAYRRSGDIDKGQIGEAFDAAEDFLKQLNERTSQ